MSQATDARPEQRDRREHFTSSPMNPCQKKATNGMGSGSVRRPSRPGGCREERQAAPSSSHGIGESVSYERPTRRARPRPTSASAHRDYLARGARLSASFSASPASERRTAPGGPWRECRAYIENQSRCLPAARTSIKRTRVISHGLVGTTPASTRRPTKRLGD